MITEDYVSFETAKLLKEKEFDEACHAYYHEDDGKLIESYSAYAIKNMSNPCFFGNGAPTLQMVMKWLREVHNIDIIIVSSKDESYNKRKYTYVIVSKRFTGTDNVKRSYEEACDAAIKYCLENLI